jgi:hypothetical protein
LDHFSSLFWLALNLSAQFIEAWECWIWSLLQRCGTANPFGQILNLTELTAVFVGL